MSKNKCELVGLLMSAVWDCQEFGFELCYVNQFGAWWLSSVVEVSFSSSSSSSSLSLIFYFERLVQWVGLTRFSVCWMGLTNLDVWILLLMVVAWACGVQIVWFEASDDWVHNGWLVRLCDLRLLMTEVTMGACWIVDCHRWWVCGGFRGLGSRVIVDWL